MNNDDYVRNILKEYDTVLFAVENDFLKIKNSLLLQNPSLDSKSKPWSVAQNIHHLMLTNEFYIDQFILLTKKNTDPTLKTYQNSKFWSWIIAFLRGEKSTKIALPAPSIVQPFKNDADINPVTLIKNYIAQLELLKTQYLFFTKLDLRKHKVKLPFGLFFYVPLGAAMELVLAHNTRHINQIYNTLKYLNAV